MATRNTQTHRRDKRLIDVAERMLMGDTQAEIAFHHDVSTATISRDVKTIKTRWLNSTRDTVGEFVAREGSRLEFAIAKIMPRVKAGRFGAVDRLVKLIDLKMKLYGIDQAYLAENLRNILGGDRDINREVAAISDGLRELETLFNDGSGGGDGAKPPSGVPIVN